MESFAGALFRFGQRLAAVVKASADPLYAIPAIGRMGGGSDRHHFGDVRVFVPSVVLRIVVRPGAAALAVAEPGFPRVEPAVARREKRIHFRSQRFPGAEYQRFALPAEPQFFVQSFRIDVVVHLFQRLFAVGQQRVEYARDLRRPVSFAAHFPVNFHQLGHDRQIDHFVGHVDDDNVHAGVGKHLRVFADDPLVVGDVIAQVGFAPVVESPDRSVLRGVRTLVQQFLDVVRT